MADRAVAPVSDRPIHPRGGSEVAPGEGGHADDGRRPDHHLDCHSHAALGGPASLLRLGRAAGAGWLRTDWIPRRLPETDEAAEPRRHRPPQVADASGTGSGGGGGSARDAVT